MEKLNRMKHKHLFPLTISITLQSFVATINTLYFIVKTVGNIKLYFSLSFTKIEFDLTNMCI